MKNSYKLSDATHVLVYIYLGKDEPSLSSNQIAESVSTNAGVIRRLMSQLSKSGLIVTKPGVAEPKLSRSPDQITLLDVFNAVEDGEILKVDSQTNVDCPVGKNIQTVLGKAYSRIEEKAFNEMKKITLRHLIDELVTEIEQ